jgi:hypothetical protein
MAWRGSNKFRTWTNGGFARTRFYEGRTFIEDGSGKNYQFVKQNCIGRKPVCAPSPPPAPPSRGQVVESSWNVMAHVDSRRGGECGRNWRMEWVASTFHITSELRWSAPRNMVYPALLPLMRTIQLPVVDWNEAHADLNGLVCFAERRNLVSARVPTHFKRNLLTTPIL